MAKSERIYSAAQLVQAMRSGVTAIRDQLQVLVVLDGTASQWPGVNQAVSELDYLIDMSSISHQEMEDKVQNGVIRVRDVESELFTLRETVVLANRSNEGYKNELADVRRDFSQMTSKLDTAKTDLIQQKQELWALEKQRADLASEAEKYKQDSEYMEGEIRSLRVTNTDQLALCKTLKGEKDNRKEEEVAARNADCLHMKQQTIEQRRELVELRKKIENSVD
eukprot:gene20179-26916_t